MHLLRTRRRAVSCYVTGIERKCREFILSLRLQAKNLGSSAERKRSF